MLAEPYLICNAMSLTALPSDWRGTVPEISAAFQSVARCFDSYDLILKPDTIAPGWWAGAPSVVQDKDGVFWLACRMRTAEGERGLRGYEIRILRSEDGIHFEKVHQLRREDVPIPGFERPSLLTDPATGRFKLYGCGPWQGGPWSIIKFEDAESPDAFRADRARVVIGQLEKTHPFDVPPDEYKDPVILYANGTYHCYVIGVVRRTERIFHFTSADGEVWRPAGNPYEPIMHLQDWHNFYVRPASVLPVGIGYLFIYEGSTVSWFEPVYNILTGVGFTFDLHTIIDLTPESPLLKSATPGPTHHTWRYSHWMWVGDEIWIYAEVATPEGTNEIRRFRLPVCKTR
ncbi:MAG TPA: hypothetical protein PLC40_07515 [Candidatus Hydrogenedentes bacterium]|nr:hypothetical protein [Candidatus Hydrogenedentota bacterium]